MNPDRRENLTEVTPSPRRQRIAVADDDPALRMALVIALEGDGYETVEIEDGASLLAFVNDRTSDSSGRVDLIITDIRMPGFSGLGALAALRQLDCDTPCIVVTAYPSPVVKAEALRLGAAAVFHKPFDIDDLRAIVAKLAGCCETLR